MKVWQKISIIGIGLVLIIVVSFGLIQKLNPTMEESKIKELVWSEISKDIKDVAIGGFESATVSKFKVEERLKGAIFENNTTFDYDKYAGKMLYSVIFQCKRNDKTEPYLVYFDPETQSVIATRWGYIGLD